MSPRDLRAARVAMNLTQDEMAERLGVDVAMLVGWERGTFPMPKLAEQVLTLVKQPSLL